MNNYKSKRESILQQAILVTTKDRNETYGGMENNFEKIAKYWSLYLNSNITAHDVAIMMVFLKIVRLQSGVPHEDNYIDGAGYLACAAEIALK